jgi:phage baseplate assembly protein W
MRRDYGSRLYELVDAPMNRATLVDIYAATAEALLQWEPRLALKRVRVSEITIGKVTLFLEADYLPTGKTMTLENIIV